MEGFLYFHCCWKGREEITEQYIGIGHTNKLEPYPNPDETWLASHWPERNRGRRIFIHYNLMNYIQIFN